ncbi:hypothetical protein VNO77_43255 [Canavalia gladiata]|uniref:Polygalacturonase n=1 Tax=Canavalia gladiata TaxID=3824 RepID=A0AAN9JTW1_CANGL
MNMQMKMICFALLLLLTSSAGAQTDIFRIIKYETISDGDITEALRNAWQDACASTTPNKILVPEGRYTLKQIEFRGPCMAPIEVQIDGTIEASPDPSQFDRNVPWVSFNYINFFTLSGAGTFDGRGALAWKQNDCATNKHCKRLSMNFDFGFLINSVIRDITSKDSKNFHINVVGCNNLTFTNMNIIAPQTSLNTDGIHIGRSSQINVMNTRIATGDDCISLADGSTQINVLNVTCGPGHGFSVGSLGKYPREKPVSGFTVKNCTLNNTQNGVRIKTWPNTPVNITVTDITFEDITMINVNNPIIIDQEYCPWNQCTGKGPSNIRISEVVFKNITGTSASRNGVTIICSSSVPCEYLEFDNVFLTFKGTFASAKLANVRHIILRRLPPLLKWLMRRP